MNRRIAAVCLALVASAAIGAGAQQRPPADRLIPAPPLPPPPPPPGVHMEVGMLAVEPFETGQAVENAPYSAEVVTEVTQDLADGNRIERRVTGRVARDGRGRVRREQQLSAIGPMPVEDAMMVTIADPVAGAHYTLDPARKTATRSRRARALHVTGGAHEAVTFTKAAPPGLVQPAAPGAGRSETRPEQYEGLPAEVTRTVTTLPAGAIGNLRPIEIVNERWYSPDLRVVVFSRRTDPRFGETVYKLTNIVRAEPDASLFQVPADFKRQEVRPLPPPPPPPGVPAPPHTPPPPPE
jgi:hypothetical protein